MKKIIRSIIVAVILIATPMFISNSFADAPPDPGSGGPGGGDLPVGGGAPLGSGLVILLALGATYGGKKTYNAVKRF